MPNLKSNLTQRLGQIPVWQRLLALVLVAGVVRLHGITNEPADWHAFRQADTASVTREYVKHGIDLLRPHYHDLSNIQSGKDNLEGYRMVEFPLVNAGIALIIRLVPSLSLVIVSRLAAVLASLSTLLAIWLIGSLVSDKPTAWWAAILFAFLPYSVYYSRVILPEPFMLAAITWSIAAFCWWLKSNRWEGYGGSLLLLMVALLLKPFVAFLAPVYAILVILKWRWSVWKHWELIVYGVLAVAPMLWWRSWITQYPTGIPASDWLFNGNGIRWRPAWFRWLGYERVTKLITGYAGPFLLPLGLLFKRQDTLVYLSWWLGIAAYMSIIATGNVQHDYYQVLLVPIICLTMARGLVKIIEMIQPKISADLAQGVAGCIVVGLCLASWQSIKGYFTINHWEYIRAGQAADRVLPAEAKVIAPAFGDTQFLYQTNRTGWPIGFEMDDKIAKGAQYYIATSDDDEARALQAEHPVIDQGEGYKIIDLTRKISR